MNHTSHARSAYILLPLLIAGCSNSQSDQPNKTASAVATPRTAAATSALIPASPAAPASSADAVVPATSAKPGTQSPAPPPETPAAEAPAQPATPRPNQANQAALAKQWDTAMEVSGLTPAAPLQSAPPEAATSAPTHTGEPPQPPLVATAMMTAKQPTLTAPHAASHGALAKATHPADIAAEFHAQPPASMHLDASIAAKVSPPVMAAAAGSMEAKRQARFASVASHLQRTVPLRVTGPNPSQTVMMLKLGNVGISNFDDAIQVHFAIQTLQNDWTDEYLDPRDTREFFCNAMDSPGCLFWMKTGDKAPVEYAMDQSHRYAIFWDPDKEIWDLQRVASNADGGN